ncbi:hypothetical protein SLE2022_068750 [Rubroshorea leprosula]
MHLWPSAALRDSFKVSYLKKLEWNLHRMNSEKRSQTPTNRQKLLDNKDVADDAVAAEVSVSNIASGAFSFFRDTLMVLSCFCCGACIDQEMI